MHRPVHSDELARNRALLARLEDVVEAYATRGSGEDAAAVSRFAAYAAAFHHGGLHASERLESALLEVAEEQLRPHPAPKARGPVGRVLHVLTEAYSVGGHARVAWRWIARDGAREHSLAFTGQRFELPDGLTDAAHTSGGQVHQLPPAAPYLTRAQALRDLAAGFDAVVLYPHADDPVPLLALGGRAGGPLVIRFNHSDHCFWLGRAALDVCVEFRPYGAGLSQQRRGIPAGRCLEGSNPVSGGDATVAPGCPPPGADARASGRAAMAELGIPADAVVLLSVGSPYKYRGPAGTTLADLVEPVLAADPRAHLLIVGAEADERWHALSRACGGRVAAIGPRPGIEHFYAAADVYLESRPVGGSTAAAEAAAHGLPVVSVADTDAEALAMVSAPNTGTLGTRGAGEYRELVARLVSDPDARREHGERARAAVAAADADWERVVEDAYSTAAELGPPDVAELAAAPVEEGEIDDLISSITAPARMLEPSQLELAVTLLELTVRNDTIRALFGSLSGPRLVPEQQSRIAVAAAAPPPEPEALEAVVAEFRRLATTGLAERFVLALRPDDADGAVPVIEAALARGVDVDIDLLLRDEPAAACPPGALVVTDSAYSMTANAT